MTTWLTRFTIAFLLSIIAIGQPPAALAQTPIKIGLVQGFTIRPPSTRDRTRRWRSAG